MVKDSRPESLASEQRRRALRPSRMRASQTVRYYHQGVRGAHRKWQRDEHMSEGGGPNQDCCSGSIGGTNESAASFLAGSESRMKTGGRSVCQVNQQSIEIGLAKRKKKTRIPIEALGGKKTSNFGNFAPGVRMDLHAISECGKKVAGWNGDQMLAWDKRPLAELGIYNASLTDKVKVLSCF